MTFIKYVIESRRLDPVCGLQATPEGPAPTVVPEGAWGMPCAMLCLGTQNQSQASLLTFLAEGLSWWSDFIFRQLGEFCDKEVSPGCFSKW